MHHHSLSVPFVNNLLNINYICGSISVTSHFLTLECKFYIIGNFDTIVASFPPSIWASYWNLPYLDPQNRPQKHKHFESFKF